MFGSVGTYDRIVARATVALSPSDPRNAIIVDLDRAPRNAQGLVEATADVEILRPTNAANGNRRLIYDVVNRGTQRALAYFNDAPAGNDFSKAAAAGNGFLMNRGYTVVISGWQGDLGPRSGWQTISLPVVPGVTGISREEFIFDHTRNPAVGDAHLSGGRSRSRQGNLDGAPARDRSARHARRPQLHVRRAGQGLDQAAGRLRCRRDLRADLSGEGSQADGHGLRRDPRHRLVPAPRNRGRVGHAQSGRRPHRLRGVARRLAERALPARPALSRLQRGRSRARGVRRPDAAHRRRQEDVHELPLCAARPQHAGARRDALSRHGVPVQLSGDDRSRSPAAPTAGWRAASRPRTARRSSRPTPISNSTSRSARW